MTLKALKKSKFAQTYIKPIYQYCRFFYFRNKKYKKNGTEVLLQAKKALDAAGIFFWLDFGTLLGVYRDGKLIKNDLDIDIGVFLKDYNKNIENEMFKYGFKLVKQYEIDEKRYGLEQTYEYKGVTLDIFYYGSDDEKMWMHSFTNFPGLTWDESIKQKGGLLTIEAYLPKNGFKETNFLSTTFNIPYPPEKHLSNHYGDDFLTPRKWDYTDLKNDNINAKILPNHIGKIKTI